MSQQQVNAFREALKRKKMELAANAGKGVNATTTGPIGIGIVEELFAVVEAQQKKIDELETLIHSARGHSSMGL